MSFALLKDYMKRQYISLLHLDAAKGKVKEKTERAFLWNRVNTPVQKLEIQKTPNFKNFLNQTWLGKENSTPDFVRQVTLKRQALRLL